MDSVNLFTKPVPQSIILQKQLQDFLKDKNCKINRIFQQDALYNVVIGGDGTFLRAAHESDFSKIPFVGINTGHLGFFQESDAESMGTNLKKLFSGDYYIDELNLIKATIVTSSWTYELWCVNEFALKSSNEGVGRFDVSIDGVPLINQSGDGLMISTPSGSTAYNLSAGGSILYQTLQGFQITPISPLHSKSYNCLPASLVVPSGSVCTVSFGSMDTEKLELAFDGRLRVFHGLKKVIFTQPGRAISRVAFNPNWYWYNLKEKFL